MPRRHNAKGRTNRDARHVRLYHHMLNSPAWASLKPPARAVYIVLESRHNGSNNGSIPLSVREAATACRIGKDTAGRALGELVEKGFIIVTTPGGFSRKVRHSTEYRLTAWPTDDALPTKDFMRWRLEI